jgi:serine/threonine-protein kinase
LTPQGTAGFPRPFGKYTLLQHLAVGGMADVFLAAHTGPAGFQKECVIKRILPHLGLDREFVQMFLDEARLSARLSHPNIVQIFDLGKVDGDYFLAMEYVDGVNLEQILDAARVRGDGAVPWAIAARIVADVAAGLDHAHNSKDPQGRPLGLVHRDVSPSNVMVSFEGATKILDFGIAKAVPSSIKQSRTEVGTIKGKIPYMSPEQLQGQPLDGRSDVFSLGVLLYEVTCGARPFPAESAGQLTLQILHEEPIPPEHHRPGYPPGLKAIIRKALAKRPEERFQSAREFQLVLSKYGADQRIAATTYDVEAYLRGLFPEGRRHGMARVEITGTERTEVSSPLIEQQAFAPQPGRVATPVRGDDEKERQPMSASSESGGGRVVTGLHQGPQGRLEDLQQGFDDLDHEDHRRRRGGSGGIVAVIVILVALTAAGLFVLRGYVMGQDNQAPAAAADLATAPAPAAVDAATVPEPVKEPVREQKAEPQKAEKAEPQKAVREKEHKEPKRAEPVRQRKPVRESAPPALPRLPAPPPPDPE